MNLHLEGDTYQELIVETADSMILPQLHVEKDYWITRALKHLSGSDYNRREEFGQVSSHLILELNTFGNPYPMTTKNVRTLIAEETMRTRSSELITQYGLENFEIQVLSVERTFVEKLISVVKDSYETNAAEVLSEKIRHLYGLSYILKQEDIGKFLEIDEFYKMCQSCIENERRGNFNNSEHLLKLLADAPLFSEFHEWRRFLEIAWQGKFKELVYGGMRSMDEIQSVLETIRSHL